ncbi:AraC family transcriptional regulator [Pseudoalteromonas sp. MT33b]|uniref:AraC family transcriptional regulator n=1 Tax=Pseudoalteromonas sp. MT33b TaxID=2759705 RepID=UPI0015FE7A7A|nr:AraC family transcriptional regulator [Pseudoalteromonas sp. MT33b]QMW16275.1 AraC family transcriptional regulator [Pseudoalteromonas sp. MT33b]
MPRSPHTPDLIRVSALHGYIEIIESKLINPDALLSRVGLDRKQLQEPNNFIQYQQLIELLEITAKELDLPYFGLELGRWQSLNILGSVGYLMGNCDSLEMALKNLTKYYHVHQNSADLLLEIGQDYVKLSFLVRSKLKVSVYHGADLALSVGVNLLKQLTDDQIKLHRLELPHSANTNTSVYRQALGQVPVFNCPHTALIFDRKYLKLPIKNSDKQLFSILSQQLGHLNDSKRENISDHVEVLIKQYLLHEQFGVNLIAEKLSMSSRSLQRHLTQQGTTFRELVDDIRCNLAHQYLTESSLSLSNISDILSFSNYSEFTRAFKRWYGVSPKDYRKSLLHNGVKS